MEEILEYGNTSKKLKRKVGAHTHEWIVYVRPPKGGQFIYVDKVKFTFHDTCVKPVEICSQPPYQSVQTGWGNFTIQLQVFFKYGFKPWEGAHDLVIETDSEGMQRQPDGRIGTVPKRVVVPLDFSSMTEENRAKLWADRIKAYLTRADPDWEAKGEAALTKVNMKDVRDAIRTELKLTRLNPEDWKVVKDGITQAARTVLQDVMDAKAKAATGTKRRTSSTSSRGRGPPAKRPVNGEHAAGPRAGAGAVRDMEQLRARILALPDDKLAEVHDIVTAGSAKHKATAEELSFDLFELDDATLRTLRNMVAAQV